VCVTKQQTGAAALVSMIDELGDLEAEVQPMKARIARIDTLRAALRAEYSTKDSLTPYTANGERFTLNVGAAGNATVIDRERLHKLIGPKKFMQVVTVTVKAITDLCGAAIAGAVSSSQQTGTRSLSIVPLVKI
jgi:hypothetical protein